jgi:hypothetical protein
MLLTENWKTNPAVKRRRRRELVMTRHLGPIAPPRGGGYILKKLIWMKGKEGGRYGTREKT